MSEKNYKIPNIGNVAVLLAGYITSDEKELDDLIDNYGLSHEHERLVREDDGFMEISQECIAIFNEYDCWGHIYCTARLAYHLNR